MNEEVMKSMTAAGILGTYAGECLDPHITNKNGMDITHEVIDGVFASDDYEQGIKNGWFIGFLGHPEDPNCMDFKNGCIVMREMHYGDEDKLYGTWDLLDTPVGQIVKTMQAAGIKFGVSIRGAGDLIGSEVQADTFVFRGFDLVSFPAYPESIPEFTAIAASTDATTQKNYQAVCAAVRTNLKAITSASTLDFIKNQLPVQSEERKLVEGRIAELQGATMNAATEVESRPSLESQKITAMTDLYLETLSANAKLSQELRATTYKLKAAESKSRRKLAAVQRITAAQTLDMEKAIEAQKAENAALTASKRNVERQYVAASTQLKALEKSNLKYKQDLTAANQLVDSQKNEISALKAQKRETVMASAKLEKKASNLGDSVSTLKADRDSYAKQLVEVKQAFASLYASVIGGSDSNIEITASTTLDDIRRQVVGATNTASVAALPSADLVDDYYYADDDEFEEESNDNLITI